MANLKPIAMNKFLLALAFFYFTSSYAQITFEKGYFINNNDVRINCYIENMDWNNNPKSFTYKLLENDQPKQEDFTGVREFGINNVSMYKRFTLNMERSTYEIGQLTPNKNPVFKQETHFLKALIIGDASLYVWTGDNLVKYFFETKSMPIEQLIYIRYTTYEGYRISENNMFRQQLLNSLKCVDLTEKDFKNLKYKAEGLTTVFKKYNTCANKNNPVSTIAFFEKEKRKSLQFKITAGVAAASLSITDPGTLYNVGTNQKSVVFKIGAELEYLLPFNKNTWSLFLNPSYQKFEAENTYTKIDLTSSNNSYLTHTATTSYSSIEIPIGVRRYFYVNANSKVFINAAYVVNASLGNSKIVFKNAENTINANKEVEITSKANLALGAGFSYKKLSTEIRLYTPREIIRPVLWSGKYNMLGVVIGYSVF